LVVLVLAVLSFAREGRAAGISHPPQEILLRAASEKEVPKSLVASVCEGLADPCTAASTKAYLAQALPRRVLLIDTDGPRFVVYELPTKTASARAREWIFATYARAQQSRNDSAALELFPALFPTTQGFALAVLTLQSEGFAGGGAWYAMADFVELVGFGAGESTGTKLLYAAVPFTCSKDLRACFSEEEYKHSPHCSEDYHGSLAVDFARVGPDEVKWQFVWHETHWPGLVTKKHETDSTTPFSVAPGPTPSESATLPAGVSFCDSSL
jgi:hypothetical protein